MRGGKTGDQRIFFESAFVGSGRVFSERDQGRCHQMLGAIAEALERD